MFGKTFRALGKNGEMIEISASLGNLHVLVDTRLCYSHGTFAVVEDSLNVFDSTPASRTGHLEISDSVESHS